MDGSILLLGLLVLGFAVVIPVLAIVAYRRTGALRAALDEQRYENSDRISSLRAEVVTLRRAVDELSLRLNANTRAEAGEATIPPVAEPVVKQATPAQPVPVPIIIEPAPVLEPVLPAEEVIPATLPPSAMPAEEEVAAAAFSTEPVPSAYVAPPPADPVVAEARVQAEAVTLPASEIEAEPAIPSSSPAWQSSYEAPPPRASVFSRLRKTLPLEELLGMNLFAKIGIVLLVLGFALLGRVALVAMGPAGKVSLLYAAAAALLGGGIWLEPKERYRLIGRTGIGGGWALLFFTTYAMWHVPAMRVMSSLTANCTLLLVVAVAMVAHTLRYRSQLVTGLAFLLAFSTVALSQDTVYALSAGVILAIGIVVICLRMGWYELEIFGILASFGNHFYWLYKLYPDGVSGHAFPQFWPSAIILVLYWLTFRISYVARGIRSPRDERLSTVAALLNPMLLLAVMKFQSTRPELAFYALLGLGVCEFFFGQLPATRRRRPAFVVLTVLGTILMLGSVPFKFSGNNIALLWMIGAEVLLVAGIVQSENLFRRLGLLAGILTGLLVAWKAMPILDLRQHSEAPLIHDGVLLLTCSILFYLNAHFLARRWSALFRDIDAMFADLHSYLGCVTVFIGSWAIFTSDWTAVAWAVLMLSAAWVSRRLASKHLLVQAWLLAGAAFFRIAIWNCRWTEIYPHHIPGRIITLPIIALLFYLTSAVVGSDEIRAQLRSATLWAGSAALVALAWLEIAPEWVAPAWMSFAVVLVFARRRLRINELAWQEHVLAILVLAQLIGVNLSASNALDRYVPIVISAAALYAISRICTPADAPHRRVAGWAHTWIATGLLAALAWHESPQPWLAPLWIGFALVLAAVDRGFDIEELPFQAHVLAAMTVGRAVAVNLFLTDKWHSVDERLLTVGVVVAALYALTRLVRMPASWRSRSYHHAYTWVASILCAWMLWSELDAIAVAVGIAVLGLLLFEAGMMWKQRPLRYEAYAALTAAFGRIFFVNLTASKVPGDVISPAIATVMPLALIFFYVWTRLRFADESQSRLPIRGLIAWFGTGSVAALLWFQVYPEWIVVAFAALTLALMLAALLLEERVFFHQAIALIVGTMARGIAHNVYDVSYFTPQGWRGNFGVLLLAIALLLTALPIAFRLRARFAVEPDSSMLARRLGLNYPEQWFFFAPVVLLAFLIAIRMNPGMVTLSWDIQAVLMILLGLGVSQRSYRISGLLLLVLCVGKIVFRDAWHLNERDRYITFIALGAALTLVSTLYNRYRETVRRLL
jgi:hypothetical protein